MTPQHSNRLLIVAALAVAASCTAFATDAEATCVTTPVKNRAAAPNLSSLD